MPLTIVPSPPFLAFESVSLGRFVTNIDHPHEGYYEPKIGPPTPVLAQFSFAGHQERGAKTSFGSALINIFAATVSKLAEASIRVEADEGTSYSLDNSEAWFDEALSLADTKAWVEGMVLRGRTIYLVVGVQTLTNPRVRFGVAGDAQKQADVQVSSALAATLANMFAAPSGSGNTPSLSAESTRHHISQHRFEASGEFVCAIQYRKLKHRWLSRRSLQGVQLSKTRQWSYLLGNSRGIPGSQSANPDSGLHRAGAMSDDSNPASSVDDNDDDDDDDEEDIIEVDFAADDDPE
jgi:hypothetical protein